MFSAICGGGRAEQCSDDSQFIMMILSKIQSKSAISRGSICCSLITHQHTLLTQRIVSLGNILLGKLPTSCDTRATPLLSQQKSLPCVGAYNLNKHTWCKIHFAPKHLCERICCGGLLFHSLCPVLQLGRCFGEDTCVGGVFLLRNLTGSHTQSRHVVRPTPLCSSGVFCICVACAHNVSRRRLHSRTLLKSAGETMGAVMGDKQKIKTRFCPEAVLQRGHQQMMMSMVMCSYCFSHLQRKLA